MKKDKNNITRENLNKEKIIFASTSYIDISLASPNVLYTLNLTENRAIQNFAINHSIIYTTQRINSDVILAESTITGSIVSKGGRITITNAGHGQTLEYISKGDFADSLLFSLNARQDGNNIWSTEIGIVELSKLKFSDTNSNCNYDIFKRFTDLQCANDSGISNNTRIIRADAALSTDQSTILIWTRNDAGIDLFTGYNFSVFCSQLKNSSTNTVSFMNNNTMKNACKFCFAADTSRILSVPNSFQGIELSNENNGVHSIYIVSGNENPKEKLEVPSKTNRIYRINSNGTLKKAGKIIHPYFNPGTKYEIEGVKISGDNILFGYVPSGDDVNKTTPYIMKISKSIMQ